nr:MAG TPA: hypothetical protein [Caudoviricetes sp.]
MSSNWIRFFMVFSSLIFRLTWVTIKVAGVRLPARLCGLGLRFALVGVPQTRFYLAFAARTIWAASSGVAAFASISWASVSRNALNSALVMPSAMSSLPSVRGLRPCLTLTIISC